MPLKPGRPLVDGPDSVWVGSIENLTTVGPYLHQPDITKNTQVLRDRRLRQANCGDNLRNRPLAAKQTVEDVAPTRLRDRIEDIRRGRGPGHWSNNIPMQEYVKAGGPAWPGQCLGLLAVSIA